MPFLVLLASGFIGWLTWMTHAILDLKQGVYSLHQRNRFKDRSDED